MKQSSNFSSSSDDELTFVKAYQVAKEIKEAARVAKEMVYGTAF